MEPLLNYYILFWVCILGLCLGSFYNVVILRSLSEESIIFPPSKCPKCGERLKPWHNIPVLSYIFLKGKCVYESPSVMEIRTFCQQELNTLWEETRRLVNPHKVHVDLSPRLYDMKITLLDQLGEK